MKQSIISTILLCFSVIGYGSAINAEQCDQVETLALNMYYEARGDGRNIQEVSDSMQMVGEVTLNRLLFERYPNTICEVVYQKGPQFSWTIRKDKVPTELEQWKLARQLAQSLLDGTAEYFDNGATHFLNLQTVKRAPKWTTRFNKVGKVGSHTFYSDGSADQSIDYHFKVKPHKRWYIAQ
jgi:spore germination cell wall hydrolase CwlJ-like protein